jgi:hypothetical protein
VRTALLSLLLLLLLTVARSDMLLLLVGHDGTGCSLKLQSFLQVGPRAGLAVAAIVNAVGHNEFFHDATACGWSAAVRAISVCCLAILHVKSGMRIEH